MSGNSKKTKNVHVKKENKMQAKKRKLEAFLNLVRKDDSIPIKKRSSESFAESYKALKEELKKYQTKNAIEPLFCLGDEGRNALVKFSSIDKSMTCSTPLFFEDIYHLLLKSLLGHLSPFSLKWSNLERSQRIVKTVVIDIEGLSKDDIYEMNSELDKCSIFQYVFEVISTKMPFATDLSTVHMTAPFCTQADENYSSSFPMDEDVMKPEKSSNGGITKLHLLLNPIQMAMERYPFPPSALQKKEYENYVFTKESYSPVTANSPMFALDCEMCLTTSGKNELTSVAVVNENLETVYYTLVKPKLKIINYLTKYSGITEPMLRNVTTTIEDVQEELRKILPSDAILCGQSLNGDLNAIKMFHPYVIDTSVIYNQSGIRHRKISLKNLSRIFLNEIIQNHGNMGHCPIEDSVATMKLVLLKLKNSIEFGDVILGTEKANGNLKASEEASKFADFVKLNNGPEHCGFFERITKFSHKKVCLIGDEDALNNYYLENPTDKITKVTKSSIKKVIKATLNNLEGSDLIISHLVLKAGNGPLIDIIDGLKQTYAALPNRTLFLVMTDKNEPCRRNFKHSFCMTGLKNAK